MRTNRRRMMCPVVDTNVEYIMTNGKQFILTDWIPLIDTKIEMYFHAKDLVLKNNLKNVIFTSLGEGVEFSINNGDNDNQGNILFLWNNKAYGYGGNVKNVEYEGYIKSKTPQLLCMSKDSVEYYSFLKQATSGLMKKKPLDLRTQPCTTPLSLFTGQTSIGCYNRAKLYIYGIRCWNNGILERDFVPSKKNGIYGLYDKVNKKFWRSSSGVNFLGKDK